MSSVEENPKESTSSRAMSKHAGTRCSKKCGEVGRLLAWHFQKHAELESPTPVVSGICFGHALCRLEVRSFGWLLQDLLECQTEPENEEEEKSFELMKAWKELFDSMISMLLQSFIHTFRL